MPRPRIDPEMAAKIRYVIDSCRANGLDPVSRLDEAGVLRHVARSREDRLETIDMVIKALQLTPPDRLQFNRMPTNPIDLRNVMVEFLTELRDGLARSPLQDNGKSKERDE